MPKLADPLRLGAIEAKNRMFMAPLTRGRGTADHAPTAPMIDYYRQRAGAGLIVSEATGIDVQGLGWPYGPGLWTPAQMSAWKPVTQAVHEAGGRIVAQLWHMGRLVHPDFLGGAAPVSASATTAPGHAHTYKGTQPYAPARALAADEIPGIVAAFARAAEQAMEAGFDGVQLHGANGYLIDQFLRDGSNLRDDAYGGAIEHRIRLLSEVCAAMVGAIGGERVGVRLSPTGATQGVDDSDPLPLFRAAAARLDEIGIAWLELRELTVAGPAGPVPEYPVSPHIRAVFSRPIVFNSGYTPATAQAALDSGQADAISFGRSFIANPDLPRRIADGLPLAKAEPATFYTRGPEGYTDYPAWADA